MKEIKISNVINAIENYAPLKLQDDYDNSGLQVGNVNQILTGILLCIDVTEKVVEEAIDLNCNLIVAHHPLLFRPLKKLTHETYIERCVIEACRNDIVLYASHTNLDNAAGGVSFKIAEKLELENVRVLKTQNDLLLKLVTFVPTTYASLVRNALFNAGAGHIGNYDSCTYNVSGEGTFRAGEGTNPFCGKVGELHTEPEIRIETVLPFYNKESVLQALLASHPYEEPVYDFYPLKNAWNSVGTGVVGELREEEEEESFLFRIKDLFNVKSLMHSSYLEKKIKEVAICGGSGSFLIPEAVRYGADVFITGEAKYNDYYDVQGKILLAVIGHYESEICTKELFYDIITKKIPNFDIHFSRVDLNPVNYL